MYSYFKNRYYLLRRHLHDLKYHMNVRQALEIILGIRVSLDTIISRIFPNENNRVRLALDVLKLSRLDCKYYSSYATRINLEQFDEKSQIFNIGYNENVCLKRMIELKKPRYEHGNQCIEKGVLLCKFTDTFEYVIRNFDLSRLLNDYYLVLEPSWSGYADQRVLYWSRHLKQKVIVQASEQEDYDFVKSLNCNLIPVRFGASDWVNDRLFFPIDGEDKVYDVVYVAVYAPYKRHHILFAAVRKLQDKKFKIALVGMAWKGERAEIESLLNYYGIRNQVDIFENIKPSDVNKVLNQSKVNVLLSLKEGSNKSVFEGFFAGIPAIVLKHNIGVNKQYINEKTGQLIEESELCDALRYFKENWHTYKTREWAVDNISPKSSTKKLNNIIRKLALNAKEPWTCDLMVKVNSPELRYYDDNSEYNAVNLANKYNLK